MATRSSILAWGISWTEEPVATGYSPWGCQESDMTEQLSTHTQDPFKSLQRVMNNIRFSSNITKGQEGCSDCGQSVRARKEKNASNFSESPPFKVGAGWTATGQPRPLTRGTHRLSGARKKL